MLYMLAKDFLNSKVLNIMHNLLHTAPILIFYQEMLHVTGGICLTTGKSGFPYHTTTDINLSE